MAPSLRNIRQEDAVKALVRLGGEERRGKGSHRVVSGQFRGRAMTTIRRGEEETRVSLSGFTILIHECEQGEAGYWGEVVEMPGCVSQGETIAELQANMEEATEAVRHHSTG